MEELSEALKAVEKQLNFARKAYDSILYPHWSVAFPVIHMTLSILPAYTERPQIPSWFSSRLCSLPCPTEWPSKGVEREKL
ncbi:hypothetical protein [Thermococcus sp. MAR1]|uniref:hypothetical protein n=1 Tax=Thermococcus sp. MAR1 TaxID=1638263 RepID=UPI00143CA51C|nr:hypothetical protein [Thermococcus sp. MAR1]